MGIMDFINKKKGEFQARQERARDNRLMVSVAKRQEYEKRLEKERAIRQNETFVKEAKRESFQNSFLGKLGSNAKARLSERSRGGGPRVKLNDNSIFHQRSMDSPYFATSRGSNAYSLGNSSIYTSSSKGNNPYNFSNSRPARAKRKGKSIVIRL